MLWLFDALGFHSDRSAIPVVPRFSMKRAIWRFGRILTEFVWDAAVLEGNPFSYPEVQTLIGGVTVGGRKISEQNQILTLIESSR
jgi:hypothetical protein